MWEESNRFNLLDIKTLFVNRQRWAGKTNFLCDFTENVLLKRHIPFAYVNGYEVDATDVENIFIKTICPSLDISFSK